jgi:hypothetical protein
VANRLRPTFSHVRADMNAFAMMLEDLAHES